MAGFDYNEMAALAVELLDDFGDDATVTRKAPNQTPNPDGSATVSGAAPPWTGKALEMVAGTRMGLANAGAQSTDGGTRNFSATHILGPMDPPPIAGDVLTFAGKSLTIKDARTVKPTTVPICHFVSCDTP